MLLTELDKDGVSPPSLELEVAASSPPNFSAHSDDDDVPQRVQTEEDSGSVVIALTSGCKYPFLQPFSAWVNWLDASQNRPHGHKQILCNIFMCDAVSVPFRSVFIFFLSQTLTRNFVSKIYLSANNPSTSSDKLQLLQLLTKFDKQQQCHGLRDSKNLQASLMTTGVLTEGVWQTKK